MAAGKKSLPVYPNCPKVDERFCPICNEKAPKGEVHSPHYGGICCYSCRAFFRRAHQKTKTPKLRCKQDGNCPIAPKGQLRCKKCRYEKCLSNGMSPKYVLTGDEKKIRFGNYFKKKGDLQRTDIETDPDMVDEIEAEPGRDDEKPTSDNHKREKLTFGSSEKTRISSQEKEKDQIVQELASPNKPGIINLPIESKTENFLPSQSMRDLPKHTECKAKPSYGLEPTKSNDFSKGRPSSGTNHRPVLSSFFSESQIPVDPAKRDNFYSMTYNFNRNLSPSRYDTAYTNLQPTFNYASEAMASSQTMSGSGQLSKQNHEMTYFPVEQGYQPINQDQIQPSSHLVQIERQSGQDGRIYYPTTLKAQHLLNVPPEFNYGSTSYPLNLSGSLSPKSKIYSGNPCSFSVEAYGKNFGSERMKASTRNPFQQPSYTSLFTCYPATSSDYPAHSRAISHFTSGIDLANVTNISSGHHLEESAIKFTESPANVEVINFPIPAFVETHALNFMPKEVKSENLYQNEACENQLDAEVRFSRWNDKPPAIIESFHSLTQPGSSNVDPVPLFSINAQLSHILDSFTLSTGKLCLNTNLIKELIFNHQRKAPLKKQTLVNILGQITSMLTDFASSVYLFSSLNQEDQIVLLKNNVPLYIQYVLAKYFSASNGLEQLTWILEGQVPIESIDEVQRLCRLDLKEYNNSLSMFLTSEEAELYSYHCQNVGLFYPFPQHCNGLVANLILFHINDTLSEHLQEPKRILCIYNEAKRIVRLGFEQLDQALEVNASQNIGPLIHTLHKMKSIFGNWKLQTDGGTCVKPPYHLAISYTDAEEGWLKNRLRKFQRVYLSVGFTSEYLDSLIQLLYRGTPVKENFLGMWMNASAERTLRILKMHPEFENLRTRDQDALWRQNFRLGLAIMAAKVEGLKTGKDQLRSILGHFDLSDNSWEADFESQVNLDHLKVVYLVDTKLNLGKLDQESVDLYNRTLKDLTPIIENEQNFQLFMILSLLNPEEISNARDFAEIARVRQFYLKLFQRKLYSTGYSYIDYAKFRNALNKVKVFASLLEKCGNH